LETNGASYDVTCETVPTNAAVVTETRKLLLVPVLPLQKILLSDAQSVAWQPVPPSLLPALEEKETKFPPVIVIII
jgi:hypothetical protein